MKNEKRGIGFCFFPPEGMVQGSRDEVRGSRQTIYPRDNGLNFEFCTLNFEFLTLNFSPFPFALYPFEF